MRDPQIRRDEAWNSAVSCSQPVGPVLPREPQRIEYHERSCRRYGPVARLYPPVASPFGDLADPDRRGGDRRVARLGHAVQGRADDHHHLRERRRAAGRPVAAQVQGHRPRHGQEPRAVARPFACRRDRRDDQTGRAAADRATRSSGSSSRGSSPATSPASRRCFRAPISACCRDRPTTHASAISSVARIRRCWRPTCPGRTFLLKGKRIGSVSLGSPIFFRDLTVGEVLGWDIGDMAESATIHAFVRAPYDNYVHDETRFWNASGLSVKLGGNGVEVQIESLRAVAAGRHCVRHAGGHHAAGQASPKGPRLPAVRQPGCGAGRLLQPQGSRSSPISPARSAASRPAPM